MACTSSSRASRSATLLALLLLAANSGCSNGATPDSICTRMIGTCMCFDESFRSYCISTIQSYTPTQAQLDCAAGQPCATLCDTSMLLAVCYTRPTPDAGMPATDAAHPDAAASIDAASIDSGSAIDAFSASDASTGTDAAVADSGTPCAATSCASCTAMVGCGWCRNHSSCVPGTPSGPTGGACAVAQWSGTTASCP